MKKIFIWLLLLVCPLLYGQNITYLEYFFDTDPGFGNGTGVPFTAGEDLELSFTISLDGINDGFHILFLRAKDENGKWSLSTTKPIFKAGSGALDTPPDIVAMEFYFDSDPGYGNGIPVSFTPGNDLVIDFSADLSSIPDGFHVLFMRALDAGGKWSLSLSKPVFKVGSGALDSTNEIITMEYYFDSDPGYGSATPVSFSPGHDLIIDFAADLSSVPDGFHVLFIRAMDNGGKWSLSHTKPVFKVGSGALDTPPDIVSTEFFIDNEPGYGMGTPLPINGSNNLEQDVLIELDEIPDGFHILYLRSLDSGGKWSQTSSKPFFKAKNAVSDPLPDIVSLEYFIDADSGFGNNFVLPVTPGTNITENFTAPLDTVPEGDHTLYVRASDENGNWSHTNNWPFEVKHGQPIIYAYPEEFSFELHSDQTAQENFFIYNTGDINLEYIFAIVPDTIGWILLEHDSVGIIEPQDSVVIPFMIEPQGMETGIYSVNMIITSNDTSNTELIVPISLTYTENPSPYFISALPSLEVDEGSSTTVLRSIWYEYVIDLNDPVENLIWDVAETENISVASTGIDITFSPIGDFTGLDTMMVYVYDGNDGDSTELVINVINVNDPPVVELDFTNITINEDESSEEIFLDSLVTDPDNTAEEINWSFSLASANIEAAYNTTSRSVIFTGLNDYYNMDGVQAIFTASDGLTTGTGTALIIVQPVNDPPVVDLPDRFIFFLHNTTYDTVYTADFGPYISDIEQDQQELSLEITGLNDITLAGIDEMRASFSSEIGWIGSDWITVAVNDNEGRAITVDTTEIVVLEDFDADFYADNPEYIAGGTVNFFDATLGNPNHWEWDFDNDGIIDSYVQNPSHTYIYSGYYTVSLTVWNDRNPEIIDTEIKTDYIHITGTYFAGGDTTGTWTIEGSPYQVAGDVNVPELGELVLEDDVVVNILEDAAINIEGTLIAQNVNFQTAETYVWEGLVLDSTSVNCRLTNCTFRNATTALTVKSSSPILQSITIELDDSIAASADHALWIAGDNSSDLMDIEIVNYPKGIFIGDNSPSDRATPTLTNMRVRNSSDGVRDESKGIELSGFVDAQLTDIIIEDYATGLKITNESTETFTTPTITNMRVRNSSDGVRSLDYGIDISGSVNIIADSLIIDNCANGFRYIGAPSNPTGTPTLTNMRVRNSSDGVREAQTGIHLENIGDAIVEGDSVIGYTNGISIISSSSTNRGTPTITNMRVRNSSDGVRELGDGISVIGDMDLQLDNVEIIDYPVGLRYISTGTAGRGTPTLTNMRVRNSSDGVRQADVGVYIEGVASIDADRDTIIGYANGLELITNPSAGRGTPTLTNMRVRNSSDGVREEDFGIRLVGMDDGLLRNILVEDYANGIILESSTTSRGTPTLTNMRVRNSSDGVRYAGTGITLNENCNIILDSSLIEMYGTGIGIYGSNSSEIWGNTLLNNDTGILISGTHANPLIRHNIIYMNQDYMQIEGIDNMAFNIIQPQNTVIHNNTIFNYSQIINAENADIGFYQNIAWHQNALDNPFELLSSELIAEYNDIYYSGGIYSGIGNINSAPMFISPDDDEFELREGSPCIDAGNPRSQTDPDGSIADMGAIFYEQYDELHLVYYEPEDTLITAGLGESISFNIVANDTDDDIAFSWSVGGVVQSEQESSLVYTFEQGGEIAVICTISSNSGTKAINWHVTINAYVIHLQQGWNMISVPLELQDKLLANLIPNASNLYAYDANIDDYIQKDSLNIGRGYWLYTPEAQTITLEGSEVESYTMILYEGWNLVGSVLPYAPLDLSQYSSKIYSYSNGYNKQADFMLTPYKGYWVYSNTNQQLTIDNSGRVQSKPLLLPEKKKKTGKNTTVIPPRLPQPEIKEKKANRTGK